MGTGEPPCDDAPAAGNAASSELTEEEMQSPAAAAAEEAAAELPDEATVAAVQAFAEARTTIHKRPKGQYDPNFDGSGNPNNSAPGSQQQQPRATTRVEGNHRRTYFANRKVAIVEELHFQKSGRSLQQQMNKVQEVLKLQVIKVGNLEERGATQGDIDALARQKCDVSEVNLMSQRIEARIREGLNEKFDVDAANKALKKKVNLVDLKDRVKSFVQPLVYTIIGEKLPEAVEETKQGLVQLVKRMFDVDPQQRADMENVARLIKEGEEARAALTRQAKEHLNEVAQLRGVVAEALDEVRATAADKLREQTEMMQREMDSKLEDMTVAVKKIQNETEAKVSSAVTELREKNTKALEKVMTDITQTYNAFVEKVSTIAHTSVP